jgi:hypothetical protein
MEAVRAGKLDIAQLLLDCGAELGSVGDVRGGVFWRAVRIGVTCADGGFFFISLPVTGEVVRADSCGDGGSAGGCGVAAVPWGLRAH